MEKHTICLRVFTFVIAATVVFAGEPEFDAASVKVDNGPFVPGVTGRMRGGPGTSDPGRFTATQRALKYFIALAYDLSDDQIEGPRSLDDTLTITVTMPPSTTKEQFRLMLRHLLIERFRLALRHETREFPGYDLLVASGGPKLKEWVADSNLDAPSTGKDERGFPRLRPGQPGSAMSITFGGKSTLVREVNRKTMAEFAKDLGGAVNRSNGATPDAKWPRVTDKTGLTKIYEFRLEYAGTRPHPEVREEFAASDPGEDGPTLFAALEKQLGLKLVKSKNVPVDVLVVEHVEKAPLEN